MVHFATLLLFISLVVVIYQDFKSREVSVASFLVVLLSLLYVTYPGDVEYWGINSCINVVIVVLQLLVSLIVISVRQQKVINIVNVAIGMGDIVMLGIFAVNFSVPFFLLITLVSLIVSLLYFVIGKILNWERSSIPLAGIMAMVLVVVLGFKCCGVLENIYDIDNLGLMMIWGNV